MSSFGRPPAHQRVAAPARVVRQRSDARLVGAWRAQRGATLTGYALIVSTVVVGSLGAIRALDASSTEFLESTGDSIGESRPTRAELAAGVTEEDPGGGPITTPDTSPPPSSFDWEEEYSGVVATSTGLCVGNSGGQPATATCSADGALQTQFFANDDDETDHVQVRVDGLCLTRLADDAVASLAGCQDGNHDQLWLQTPSGNLTSVGSPGQCLDIDGPTVGAPGADIYVSTCHGGGSQVFSLPGAYVPPTQPEVLAVSSTQASLTGSFEVDANGFLHAPEGTGSSYRRPGQLGTATFEFTIAEAGRYRIEGTVNSPSRRAGSFWVTTSLDGNTQGFLWDTTRGTSPTSDFVSDRNSGAQDVVLEIPAGTTLTIVVSVREDGTRLGGLRLVAQ